MKAVRNAEAFSTDFRASAGAAPLTVRRMSDEQYGTESHQAEAGAVGTGEAVGQREPGVQSHGLQSRQFLPLQGTCTRTAAQKSSNFE